MNPDEGSKNLREGDCSRIETASVQEFLGQKPRHLTVAEGTELLLSPYDADHADYFTRVQITSFEDLKMLGFIPRAISEEKLRAAISRDDAGAKELAERMLASRMKQGCGCGGEGSHAPNSYGRDLRGAYVAARNRYHPALAELLSEHLRTPVAWDSPVAGIVRKWAFVRDAFTIIPLLWDIRIDRGATLSLDTGTKSLLAGTIWIHRTGRLVIRGSYVKIWAHAIHSFSDITGIRDTILDKLPWRGAN